MPESFDQQLARLRDLASTVSARRHFGNDAATYEVILAPETRAALVELLRRWDEDAIGFGPPQAQA